MQVPVDKITTISLQVRLLLPRASSSHCPGKGLAQLLGLGADGQSPSVVFDSGKSSTLSFGIYADQMPGMELRCDDPNSTTTMFLSALATGPSVRISNRRAGGGLALGLLDDDMAYAELSGVDGPRMLFTSSGQKGEPVGIVFNSAAGSRVARVNTSDKLTSLSLFDNQRQVRSLLGTVPGQNPKFFLYDRAIHPLIEMSIDAQGLPLMKVNDFAAGESRTLR